MITKIETNLPSYARLSNVYKTENNADALLQQGFGVGIGQASRNRVMDGSLGIERDFTFTLTQALFTTENDDQAKAAIELALMNDQLVILKAFENDFTLGGAALQVAYMSDSGVQFNSAKSDKFLELKTTVSVLYIEPVI